MFRFAIRFVAALVLAVPLLTGVAAAQSDDADAVDDIPQITLPSLPLDKLFDELAVSPDETHSARFEAEILKRLHSSGSATTDLLLSWAVEAMNKERYTDALDILDQVILLDPDFAEGWNKRATVHFLMKDYGKSIADIQHTLALEPRHFGALSGLGMILRDIGEDHRAVEVFRRTLSVHPQLKNTREALESLEAKINGEPI
jgi:tetratricopeptide (TPR) repeat protein